MEKKEEEDIKRWSRSGRRGWVVVVTLGGRADDRADSFNVCPQRIK